MQIELEQVIDGYMELAEYINKVRAFCSAKASLEVANDIYMMGQLVYLAVELWPYLNPVAMSNPRIGGPIGISGTYDIRGILPPQYAALQKVEIRFGANTRGQPTATLAVNIGSIESRTTYNFSLGKLEQQGGVERKLGTVTVCNLQVAELVIKLRPISIDFDTETEQADFGYKVGLQAKIGLTKKSTILIQVPFIGGGIE